MPQPQLMAPDGGIPIDTPTQDGQSQPRIAAPGLVEAAIFANLVYSDSPTAPDGWTLIAGETLGLTGTAWDDNPSDTTNSPFVYDIGPAQAIVATSGSTLVLAFRGSDEPGDLLGDIVGGGFSFAPYYLLFTGLIDAVDTYVANAANGITDVVVAGHSLGGAMVEWFMPGHPDAGGTSYSGYAFGSPGDATLPVGSDGRLWTVGHSGDPVFGLVASGHGADVTIDLPASPDWTLSQLISSVLVNGGSGEHGAGQYLLSAQLMAQSDTLFPRYLASFQSYDVTVAQQDPLYGIGAAGGTAGQDYLIGDDSRSLLVGGGGNDLISGLGGNDILLGQDGADWLDGGTGRDVLAGGNDEDNLFAGEGSDTLLGGTGNDSLNGDGGNDTLLGEAGNDTLNGGTGDDVLSGGTGVDLATGGAGGDIFAYTLGDGVLTITDFEDGIDDLAIIGAPAGISFANIAPLLVQDGADVVIGGGATEIRWQNTLVADLGADDFIFV